MTTNPKAIRALLHQLTAIRRQLFRYRIRDFCDYGEVLVAKALGGTRHRSRVVKGHDIVAPVYNRVQVRSRMQPLSGKVETRVPLKAGNRGDFDWLAVPIFSKDGNIKAAYLLPHDAAWELAGSTAYSRFPLSRAMAHPAARDITVQLHDAERNLST